MNAPDRIDPADVARYLRGQGLGNGEIAMFVAVLKHESDFDPAARHLNATPPEQVRRRVPRTTIDRGIAQWNDHWHKEITNECAFNWRCALSKMIGTYRADGDSLGQWGAYKTGAWKPHRQLGWLAVRLMVANDRVTAETKRADGLQKLNAKHRASINNVIDELNDVLDQLENTPARPE